MKYCHSHYELWENRFNIKFLNEMLTALDDIEKKTDVKALVVHSGDQKIWSNGMDLEWLIPQLLVMILMWISSLSFKIP